MFKGIIHKIGVVKSVNKTDNGINLKIETPEIIKVNMGDSVCVNGVCLSVVDIENNDLKFDVMNETLNKSNLKNLKEGQFVNLEESLKLGDTIDGHFVSGHIDKTVIVESIIEDGFAKRIKFKINKNDLNFIVEKGSVSLNGVSLTVSSVDKDSFEVSLIPVTQQLTTFKHIKDGDIINIEYDIFSKYINNYMELKYGR